MCTARPVADLFLALDVPGIFQIPGSEPVVDGLQAEFEKGPGVRTVTLRLRLAFTSLFLKFGKSFSFDLAECSMHDVAALFIRFLTLLPVSCLTTSQ